MTLGQTLAGARTSAGLSLEDVSRHTRVRVPILQAMEGDDFASCGGDFYARANIREFARVVGASAAELLDQYENEQSVGLVPVGAVFEPDAVLRTDRRRVNWSAAMATALVIVVALGLGNVVFRRNDSSGSATTTVNEALGGSRSPSPTTSRSGASSPKARAATPASPSPTLLAQAPRTSVTVVLAAVAGKSWVSATNGAGRQLFQGVLSPGQSETFVDKSKVRLRLGNAGGVELTVNGHNLGAPGGQGQVTTVEFTPQDPAAG